jgi:hypothetical protein
MITHLQQEKVDLNQQLKEAKFISPRDEILPEITLLQEKEEEKPYGIIENDR